MRFKPHGERDRRDRIQAVEDFRAGRPWPDLSSAAYDAAREAAAMSAARKRNRPTFRRHAAHHRSRS